MNWKVINHYDIIHAKDDGPRNALRMKESRLADTYIAVLGLDKTNSRDASALKNWMKPVGRGSNVSESDDKADHHDGAVKQLLKYLSFKRRHGNADFPLLLYKTIKARTSVTAGTLSIREVNELLDELTEAADKYVPNHSVA